MERREEKEWRISRSDGGNRGGNRAKERRFRAQLSTQTIF